MCIGLNMFHASRRFSPLHAAVSPAPAPLACRAQNTETTAFHVRAMALVLALALPALALPALASAVGPISNPLERKVRGYGG